MSILMQIQKKPQKKPHIHKNEMQVGEYVCCDSSILNLTINFPACRENKNNFTADEFE